MNPEPSENLNTPSPLQRAISDQAPASLDKLSPNQTAWLRRVAPLYWLARFLKKVPADLFLGGLRRVAPVKSRLGPPKGTYRECERVRRGEIPGRIIREGQTPPVLSRDSLRAVCGLGQDGHQPWPIFCSHRREARLVGRTLALMDERKRLALESVYAEHCLPREPAYRYVCLPPATRLSGNWTSLLSRWSLGYYHWFTDALPRLALLDEFPPDTKILIHEKLARYQAATLEYLGLAHRVRPAPERHLLVENYFFSAPPAMTGCWNPYAAEFLRRKFLPWADADFDPPRRFFIRRVGKSRGLANEAEVIAFFERRGWSIVDPEGMSLPRQIQLFARAEAICGLHGAGLTNLLWCEPGCRVVELCARNYLNGCYEGMAVERGLDYRHLICEADAACVARVDLAALSQALDFDGREPR